MKRMNCYFLLLAASLCVLPLHAQKEYPIDRITAIKSGRRPYSPPGNFGRQAS